MDYKFLVDTIGRLTATFLVGLCSILLVGNDPKLFLAYIIGASFGTIMAFVFIYSLGKNVQE